MGPLINNEKRSGEAIELSKSLGCIQERVFGLADLKERVFSPPYNWRWDGKKPVICDVNLAVDKAVARELFRQILRLLVTYKPEWSVDAAKLESLSEGDFLDLTKYTISGNIHDFNRIVRRLGSSQELAQFTFSHTVKPFFRIYALSVLPMIDTTDWKGENCPICGKTPEGLPDDEGRQDYKCDYCGTTWIAELWPDYRY